MCGQWSVAGDRGQRLRFHVELKRRGQPDGPNHSQGVLVEASIRIADGTQQMPLQIAPAVVRVNQARVVGDARNPGTPPGTPATPPGTPATSLPAGSAPQAMAFTVKSRRARSSSIDRPNSMPSGWR
jgi:hypothetical protein